MIVAVSENFTTIADRPYRAANSSLRRMRQILRHQLKPVLQFQAQIFESGTQLTFNSLPGSELLQTVKTRNQVTKGNPDRRPPKWQPALLRIQSIAPDDHAGQNGK